ncbi:Rieske (2Fe-2S) protein [Mucilaginibacter sp.]|uniref:Rieske (2Fe-2S) protein n=1 Tax=Mucilaginibacter sp. TaxID=1882438 RepID=UPI003D12092C
MRKIFLLITLSLAFISCGKSGDVVPNVSVNIQIALTDPRVSALNVAGGSAFIGGGVAGIILYRETDGSYAAYDRCSSYQPQNHCAVTLDASGFTVTDPCSGSKFSLADGTPVKAPATRSLKSYTINVSNFEIFVSN